MESESGVPAGIEAAWGLRPRPHKGPKRGLTLDRVVRAAVEAADAEGLDGVSMSKVAKRLGVSTMSLYRYVATKDELVELMIDTALGPPPPPPDGAGWREALAHWADAMRTAFLAHPWATLVPVTGPPTAPNHLAWLDRALHALRGTGLTDIEQVSAVLLVSSQMRAEASLAVTIGGNPDAAALAARYSAFLLRVTDDGRLPDVRRVVEGGAFEGAEDDLEMDTEFSFSLARVLDGIEALVRSRPGTPGQEDRSSSSAASASGTGSSPPHRTGRA